LGQAGVESLHMAARACTAVICGKIADSFMHARLLARKIVFNGRRSFSATGITRLPVPHFGFSSAFNTLLPAREIVDFPA
jgi:hypothetical protein